MSSSEESAYLVIVSEAVAERIRNLQRYASHQGRGEEFLAAMGKATDRLRYDPTDFGEPIYRLPALRLQVRCAVIPPLGIHFADHDIQPLVFVKAARLMSRGPSSSQ